MNQMMTASGLRQENAVFCGSGGVSQENRSHGFRPALLDSNTGAIYASCFTNGQPAPFHPLDGLPDDVVMSPHPTGRVAAVKASVMSGFVREGRFYTCEETVQDVIALSWLPRAVPRLPGRQ